MNLMKKFLGLTLVSTMMVGAVGCTSGKTQDAEVPSGEVAESTSKDENKKPIEISYATFMVGSHVSAQAEKQVIEEFNAEYGDEIKIVMEELPSDSAYVDKMKTLAASKALPDIIMGKEGIRELAIENGQAVDLMPLLAEDAEWTKYVGEGAITYNQTEDDALYSIANAKQIIGYFYNKDIFEKAGVTPAKTWDEFMANNEKIKAAGYAPLTMMTGENCWTTNLLLAGMIGTDGEEGNAFMNTSRPKDYNHPSVIKALDRMKVIIKDYSTPDAMGAIFANAANNFLQEKTAIVANGPWMVADFNDETKATPGLAERIGVALFPEDGIIEQYEVGYTLCTNGESEEVQEAALKFLKFKTGARAQEIFLEKSGALPLTANVEIPESYKTANPLVAELLDLSGTAKYTFENIDNTAYPNVIPVFSSSYPSLVYDEITAEDMAKQLTDAAGKN